jgi:hypothetical protein
MPRVGGCRERGSGWWKLFFGSRLPNRRIRLKLPNNEVRDKSPGKKNLKRSCLSEKNPRVQYNPMSSQYDLVWSKLYGGVSNKKKKQLSKLPKDSWESGTSVDRRSFYPTGAMLMDDVDDQELDSAYTTAEDEPLSPIPESGSEAEAGAEPVCEDDDDDDMYSKEADDNRWTPSADVHVVKRLRPSSQDRGGKKLVLSSSSSKKTSSKPVVHSHAKSTVTIQKILPRYKNNAEKINNLLNSATASTADTEINKQT